MLASKNRQILTDSVRPRALRGLDQALFILEHLCEGELEDKIVQEFEGDKQLVQLWLNFLKHNHWVKYDIAECQWTMTERSKEWAAGVLMRT
jgi:DNA-binding IclR family transcriptional regulator